jgi:type I restriction enzyme, S subunit
VLGDGAMSEWKDCKLGNITSKIGSGATPTGGENSYKSSGIALIRSQNVNDFSFDDKGLAFIDEDQANQLKNVCVQENDILLNITGESVTRCCIAPKEYLPARVNQHVSIIRPSPEIVSSLFIFYYLHSIKPELNSMAEIGCTRRALTKEMLENLMVYLPPIPQQHAIAEVLSSLDDKIDLLYRQNKTLEGMVQTIFRKWFLEDSDDSDGDVKAERIYLGDVIDTISETHPLTKEQIIFLNTSDIDAGKVLKNEYENVLNLPGQAKKSIQRGDILFSEIRPANKRYAYVDFNSEDYVVSTKLMVLRSKNKISQAIIYFYLTYSLTLDQLQLIAESRSGTFPQITFDQIKELSFRLPIGNQRIYLIKNAECILTKICFNNGNIRTLEHLRDALLPKLMSGEVRVKI